MAYPRRDDHARIYAEWHRAASERAGAALIALYADDAVLESPLVPAILESKTDGVLRGKAEIAHFLEAGARSRPIDLVRWYRSDTYFSAGSRLVWEYPRGTRDGDQVEIVEGHEHRRRAHQAPSDLLGLEGLQPDRAETAAARQLTTCRSSRNAF